MGRSILLFGRKTPTCTILTVSRATFIPEDACLLGYHIASIGNSFPTFRPRVLTLPARAHCPSFLQNVF